MNLATVFSLLYSTLKSQYTLKCWKQFFFFNLPKTNTLNVNLFTYRVNSKGKFQKFYVELGLDCVTVYPTSIYFTAKVMSLLTGGKNPGEGYSREQGLLPHYLALCVYQLMEVRAGGGSYTGSVQQ
jgi:hypothetical protein